MDAERIEAAIRRVADELEPGLSARLVVGYVEPDGALQLRRFDQPDGGWVNVHRALSEDLTAGIEQLRATLWPDCPADIRRIVTLTAEYLPKLPFIRGIFKRGAIA
jgi:hypothetical protein